MHHFLYLIIIHGLAKLAGHNLHLLEINEPCAICIVKIEEFLQAISGLSVTESVTDNFEELLEVYGSVFCLEIGDH